ncbi:MAG: hypothetical protein K2R98_25600 [Gemmataceae bacterium]|nr:hypothetical protein [Gemmataceae bacterium]
MPYSNMPSRMMQLINESDNLYLSPQEQEQLLGYTRSLPKRFQAARAVEAKENDIVAAALALLRPRYPSFDSYHEHAWDKGHRDMQLVLRYTVQAMLMDDPQVAADKLLVWLRTLFMNLGLTPQFCKDTFTFLREACRKQLPAEANALLDPFLAHSIDVICDFPEPELAAV